MRRHRLSLSALCIAVACGRADAPRRVDTAVDTVAAAPAAALAASPNWDPELGALLLVPSDSDNSAIVLFSAGGNDVPADSRTVTLVSAGGDTAVATMQRTDSLECGDAPMVRLAGAGTRGWAIGMAGRSAALIRMDSIEALASPDSTALAADVARLASALPMRRGSRFGGLPFSVVAARRFTVGDRQYIVAHLARRLNQEAAPLEERTFVIAERAAGSTDPYTASYSQRSEGSEDTAEHFDILAGVRGHASPLLLIARDQLAQTRYELLTRDVAGGWRVRWTRTLSC